MRMSITIQEQSKSEKCMRQKEKIWSSILRLYELYNMDYLPLNGWAELFRKRGNAEKRAENRDSPKIFTAARHTHHTQTHNKNHETCWPLEHTRHLYTQMMLIKPSLFRDTQWDLSLCICEWDMGGGSDGGRISIDSRRYTSAVLAWMAKILFLRYVFLDQFSNADWFSLLRRG